MDNFIKLLLKDSTLKVREYLFDVNNFYLVDPLNYKFIHTPKRILSDQINNCPKIVTILLGVKCNLHCSYCIQADIRKKVNLDFSPKKINNFLDKFQKFDLNKIQRITFWGGEPLVYWKTIKILLPKLKTLCPNLKDFYLSTNGTLLTKDKISWLIENNVSIQLSDDILNVDRNVNLTKTRELFNWAKNKYPNANLSIHCCFSNNNSDALFLLNTAESIYKNNFKIKACPVSPHLIKGDFDSQPIKFDKNNIVLLEESAYRAFMKQSHLSFSVLDSKINLFINGGSKQNFACRFGTGMEICIDSDCNIFACRGSFDKANLIGNLDSLDFPIKCDKYIPYKKRIFCSKCPFLHFCRGICSQLQDNIIEEHCLVNYAYQRSIFRAILKKLYNLDLISIDHPKDLIFQHGLSYEDLYKSLKISKPTIIYLRKEDV